MAGSSVHLIHLIIYLVSSIAVLMRLLLNTYKQMVSYTLDPHACPGEGSTVFSSYTFYTCYLIW